MKPRHAAALALVGWSFLFPPMNNLSTGSDIPDVKAPLSEWQIADVDMYNSSKECLEALRHLREIPTDGMHARFEKEAICIATDDPRLKEK